MHRGFKPAASRDGLRLLVVDDDLDALSALARLLKPTCEVEIFSTCVAATRALDLGPVAGVITDLILPDGDGFQIIEKARDGDPALPALLITGHLDSETAARAFAMGVTFLPKPVTPENILAFARRCMAHRSNALSHIEALGDDWQTRYHLTPTEREVLVATARGLSREELLESRGIAETTLKRHVTNLLEKTGEDSLDRAALRFLREVLRDFE